MSVEADGEVTVGLRYELVLTADLTRTQIVQYAGAAGDYAPMHTDEIFAVQVAGLESVIAHGMLTMGMTGRLLTDVFGPASLLTFGGRFKAPVRPGDALTASAEVVGVRDAGADRVAELDLQTTNQDAVLVFQGYATAAVGCAAGRP